jgi:hypothetical protein
MNEWMNEWIVHWRLILDRSSKWDFYLNSSIKLHYFELESIVCMSDLYRLYGDLPETDEFTRYMRSRDSQMQDCLLYHSNMDSYSSLTTVNQLESLHLWWSAALMTSKNIIKYVQFIKWNNGAAYLSLAQLTNHRKFVKDVFHWFVHTVRMTYEEIFQVLWSDCIYLLDNRLFSIDLRTWLFQIWALYSASSSTIDLFLSISWVLHRCLALAINQIHDSIDIS